MGLLVTAAVCCKAQSMRMRKEIEVAGSSGISLDDQGREVQVVTKVGIAWPVTNSGVACNKPTAADDQVRKKRIAANTQCVRAMEALLSVSVFCAALDQKKKIGGSWWRRTEAIDILSHSLSLATLLATHTQCSFEQK